jgi:Zn-dependent metalloprotease
MPKKNQKKTAVSFGNQLQAKSKLSEVNSHILPEKAFETVLERLEREFEYVAQEIIEEIYEENARSYISTKKKLEEIFPKTENENKNSIMKSKEMINLNNNYSNFKEAETNFTDETDKASWKTEKSKNEKSDFSNELSRQISGTNSNLSGNAYAGIFLKILNFNLL